MDREEIEVRVAVFTVEVDGRDLIRKVVIRVERGDGYIEARFTREELLREYIEQLFAHGAINEEGKADMESLLDSNSWVDTNSPLRPSMGVIQVPFSVPNESLALRS